MPTVATTSGLRMIPYRFTQFMPYFEDTWKNYPQLDSQLWNLLVPGNNPESSGYLFQMGAWFRSPIRAANLCSVGTDQSEDPFD